MHTLFALEDLRGLTIGKLDGEICLRLNKYKSTYLTMFEMLSAWAEQAEKLKTGEITKEDYDLSCLSFCGRSGFVLRLP